MGAFFVSCAIIATVHHQPDLPTTKTPVAIAPSHTPPAPTSTPPTPSQPSTGQPAATDTSHEALVAHAPKPSPAQPIRVSTPLKPSEIITDNGSRYPLRLYHTAITPNDPAASQWWTASTDLNSAWGRGYGTYQTTVAIIDTGFGLSHEDLAGRWATNSGESGATTAEAPSRKNCTDRSLSRNASCNLIDDDLDTIVDNEAGATYAENPSQLNCTDQGKQRDKSCNLIDDDGNGYVDDYRGWDFVNYDRSVQAGETNPYGDSTMHGTMTSGTLGAIGNNGKGIAGVNWNTKILPIQAIDDDGYGDTLTLSRSILYAVSRNVNIISLSLGTDVADPYIRQAVQYAESQGILVVAASGNEGCDCVSYPARYPEVLAVGSQNSSGAPSSFSNYGDTLDILAPGENMTLPAWAPSFPTSGYVFGAAGTSFATPYVAGLLAQLKSLEPSARYGELIAALNETATHTGLTAASPRSSTLGYGLIHAGRATARVITPATGMMRYQYSSLNNTTLLDSARGYDCSGTYPSAQLYEFSKDGQIIYSLSDLQRVISEQNGWTSRSLGYQCIGQPIDTPQTVRSINLSHELRNDYSKQP